jgi:membrane protease YdiL (CAAX protease family)
LLQPFIDPDDPPWGAGIAILVWFASIALLFILQLVFIIPYAAWRGVASLKSPNAIFIATFSTLPAHVLTVLLVWAVVTRFGKRPFWETLGWSWNGYFGLWLSIGLGVVLLAASVAIAHFLGGDKVTPLEELLDSSAATRYLIAFLATLTAPFVEEFVFRGVLYSALHRVMGSIGAVVIVATLFAGVHVFQYWGNLGVIAAVTLLSLGLTLTRAISGRLLPCYVVHLVFNGIQSVMIVLSPSPVSKPILTPDQTTGLILTLLPSLHSLF